MSRVAITNDLREFNNWRCMIFGAYTVHDIIQAVQDDRWQRIRNAMKGTPLDVKMGMLMNYIDRSKTSQGGVPHNVKVQVTNYVYALKRGGLIR
jgi:hypothetical protein